MTQEIRRADWPSFLDAFGREHDGWLVTLEEIPGASAGGHVEVHQLPLRGITADLDKDSITVNVGDDPDRHLTHTVEHPRRVTLEQSARGIDQGLRIERQGGAATHILFRAGARPEEVDGVLTSS